MADLEGRVKKLEDDLSEHLQIVASEQEKFKMTLSQLATKDDIEALRKEVVTTDDLAASQKQMQTSIDSVAGSVKEIVSLFKTVKLGIHIGGRVFGVSSSAIISMGGLVVAVAAVATGFKAFLVWAGLSWLAHWIP